MFSDIDQTCRYLFFIIQVFGHSSKFNGCSNYSLLVFPQSSFKKSFGKSISVLEIMTHLIIVLIYECRLTSINNKYYIKVGKTINRNEQKAL